MLPILFGNNKRDIVRIAKNDIGKLKSPEGWLYASLGRYECFFGRDAIITSLELLHYDISIAKSTLLHLQKTQGKETNILREEEKGKIIHEERLIQDESYEALIRKGFVFPYYGNVDSTALYVLLAEKYFELSNDTKTLGELGKSIFEALEWIKSKQDKNYFIRIPALNTQGEVALSMINKNWIDSPKSLSYKDGSLPIADPTNYPVAHLEVQGMLYFIIKNINLIASFLPKDADNLIQYFMETNEKLRFNIADRFFMKEDQYFAPALDAKERKFDIVTSVPAYLLFTKAVDYDYARLIRNRLLKPDILTTYGVRLLSSLEKQFDVLSYQQGAVWPHDNWILYRGLRNYGFDEEAAVIKHAVFRAVRKLGNIPEFFNVTVNDKMIINEEAMKVQAWACGAVIALAQDKLPKKKKLKIGKRKHKLPVIFPKLKSNKQV